MTPTNKPRQTPAERIEEIRERCEKATTGPWEVYDSCSWRRIGRECAYYGYQEILWPSNSASDGHPDISGVNRKDDLDFIVNARTDIPYLLERVARLEGERDAYKAAGKGAITKWACCYCRKSLPSTWTRCKCRTPQPRPTTDLSQVGTEECQE